MRPLAPLLLVPALAMALAGCAPMSTADDGILRVVASTSVYGDVASAVAGDLAEVRSIVGSTKQDPHSYEVTARDRLALERADLVVSNGGGYDPFIDAVLSAMGTAPTQVEAFALAGLSEDAGDDHGTDANVHVWYDLPVIGDVARELARQLGELDPDHAAAYQKNADGFLRGLQDVEADLASLAETASGRGVVLTESVPGYLLSDAGFDDLTPAGFSEAIAEGSDVPPALLAATLAAVADAALVTNNPQTSGPETAEVVAAAEAAGVPVVDVLELLPDGSTYLEWMRANIAALAEALA